jgi:hypothetical protein
MRGGGDGRVWFGGDLTTAGWGDGVCFRAGIERGGDGRGIELALFALALGAGKGAVSSWEGGFASPFCFVCFSVSGSSFSFPFACPFMWPLSKGTTGGEVEGLSDEGPRLVLLDRPGATLRTIRGPRPFPVTFPSSLVTLTPSPTSLTLSKLEVEPLAHSIEPALTVISGLSVSSELLGLPLRG